jgi:serine protease inhibitor
MVFHLGGVFVFAPAPVAPAATYIEVGVTSVGAPKPPIPVFRADRPFLFFIRHVESGMILFVGRVAAPDPPAN